MTLSLGRLPTSFFSCGHGVMLHIQWPWRSISESKPLPNLNQHLLQEATGSERSSFLAKPPDNKKQEEPGCHLLLTSPVASELVDDIDVEALHRVLRRAAEHVLLGAHVRLPAVLARPDPRLAGPRATARWGGGGGGGMTLFVPPGSPKWFASL